MKALLQNAETVVPETSDFKSISDKDIDKAFKSMTFEALPEAVKRVLALKGISQMSRTLRSLIATIASERQKGANYSLGSYMLTGWGQGNEVFAVKTGSIGEVSPIQSNSSMGTLKTESQGKVVTPLSQSSKLVPAVSQVVSSTPKMEFTIEGKVTSIDVQPVPMMPGEKMRKAIQYVAPIIGALFHVKEGEIVLGINEVHWLPMFQETSLSLAGFQMFLGIVQEVLGGEVLGAMDANLRNSLNGPRWYQYVKERLTACSISDYLAVHTGFSLYVLQIDKGETAYMCTELDGESKIPPEWLRAVEEVRTAYGRCYVVTGVLKPSDLPAFSYVEKIKTVKDGERLSQVYASLEKLRSCLGSSTENYKQLTASRGYNSMMTEVERNHVWVVSATLGALSRHKRVVVKITSQGALPYLHRSYMNWLESAVEKEARLEYSLLFLVDMSAMGTMNTAFDKYCTGTIPDGYVCVWDHSAAMVGKMTTDEMEAVAKKQVAAYASCPKLIIRTAIFGQAMADRFSIHPYGTAWEFQGVMSNVGPYIMMMRNRKGYYSVEIPRVMTLLEWYDTVQDHHIYVLHGPWRPPIWISETCNVVYVDKTKIKRVINARGDVVHDMLTSLSSMSLGGEWDIRRGEEIKVGKASSSREVEEVKTTTTSAVTTLATTMLNHLPPATAGVGESGRMVPVAVEQKEVVRKEIDGSTGDW